MAFIGGLYTGLEYVAGLVNDDEEVATLDSYLNTLVELNQQDSVVSIFMMPTLFYTTDATPSTRNIAIERPTDLNGYTPRNNKLLTYPYCFLTIDCINDCKNYRYEFSGDNGKLHFALYAGLSPNVEIACCPRNYNGSGAVEGSIGTMNFSEELIMTGFPQCAFTIDAYRAWVAQKANGEYLGLLSSGIGVGAGIATGNLVVAGVGAVGMASTINSMLIESTKGSTARGNQGSSSLTAMRAKDFYIKFMCITNDYARMIDDFFDRYGYAVDRLKIPNISARPHWNYTKTKDCTITGSVPADDMRKICNIFNSGITFWKHGSEVGNYSLDNSPT